MSERHPCGNPRATPPRKVLPAGTLPIVRSGDNPNCITDHDPIYGSKAHFINDQFDLSKAIRLAQKQPPVLATPVAIKTLQTRAQPSQLPIFSGLVRRRRLLELPE
jgi:hypothetical protein